MVILLCHLFLPDFVSIVERFFLCWYHTIPRMHEYMFCFVLFSMFFFVDRGPGGWNPGAAPGGGNRPALVCGKNTAIAPIAAAVAVATTVGATTSQIDAAATLQCVRLIRLRSWYFTVILPFIRSCCVVVVMLLLLLLLFHFRFCASPCSRILPTGIHCAYCRCVLCILHFVF